MDLSARSLAGIPGEGRVNVERWDAVVTGAGRGLGRAVARALAGEGARVWICSEHPVELEETASLIANAGGHAQPVEVDLADQNACIAFAQSVARDAGDLQVIVNNAAVFGVTRVRDLTIAEWSHTLAVNLTAPFILTRDLLSCLGRTGGSVINVSSRAGLMPFEGEAAYCASKFGIEAFTRCLALELQSTTISVNSITPGLRIKPTSITEQQVLAVPEAERKDWSDPMDIAPAFVLLARLKGEVTGRRFDALELTRAIQRHGPDRTMAWIDQVGATGE